VRASLVMTMSMKATMRCMVMIGEGKGQVRPAYMHAHSYGRHYTCDGLDRMSSQDTGDSARTHADRSPVE
jgi:hypothetical protein